MHRQAWQPVQIVWYCLQGFNTDLVEVRHYQEKIVAPRLAALRGVAEVASVGGFTPQIEANVSAKALLDSRISLTSYSEQLSELVSTDLGLKSVLSANTMDTQQLVVALEQLASQKINGHDGARVPLGQLGDWPSRRHLGLVRTSRMVPRPWPALFI